jgi:hypothetical protein
MTTDTQRAPEPRRTQDEQVTVPAYLGQRHLWLMDRYRGGAGLLAVPVLLRMRGPLDQPALGAALTDLLARHDALRTTLHWRRGLHQTVHPVGALDLPIRFTDVSGAPDPRAEADRLAVKFLRVNTDVAHRSLDAALWRIGPEDHLFVLNVHHLVTDGWSNVVLRRDLGALYSAHATGSPADLPVPGWSFHEFGAWEQRHLDTDRVAAHQRFWRDQLQGARGVRLHETADPAPAGAGAVFPTHQPRPMSEHTWFELDAEVVTRLREVARAEHTTLFVVLLALYFRVLHEVGGQTDLTIASIFANRARREVQDMVGLLANLALVRVREADRPALGDVVAQVRRGVLQALAHQELPFSQLPQDTMDADPAGRSDSVVFQMLAVPPTATDVRTAFAGLTVTQPFIPAGLSARFDLELLVFPPAEAGSGVSCVFRYAAHQHDGAFIERLVTAYRQAATDAAHAVHQVTGSSSTP